MSQDDFFRPENVEEQIDQLTYSSSQEPLSPNREVLRHVHAYYQTDRRALNSMWERLTQYMAEQETTMLSAPSEEALPQSRQVRKREVISEVPSAIILSRQKRLPRFAMVAAVLFTTLLVGSMVLVLQAVRTTQVASRPSTSSTCSQGPQHSTSSQTKGNGSLPSLYLNQGHIVERIDAQTCALIWRTSLPMQNALSPAVGVPLVEGENVYVTSAEKLFALDRTSGQIRWSHEGMLVLSLNGNTLYTRNAGSDISALYAINPADGTLEATYPAPASGWSAFTIVDGILYAATNHDLSALRLSDKQVVWHHPLAALQRVERLEVSQGTLYAQMARDGKEEMILVLTATKGETVWQSPTEVGGVRMFAVVKTTLYIASFKALDAFESRSGSLLWHQDLNTVQILADQDTLYLGYLNEPLEEGSTGIAALHSQNGTVLWQERLAWQIGASPFGLHNGVLYAASNNGTDGEIDALNASDGSSLWHLPIRGNLWDVVFA